MAVAWFNLVAPKQTLESAKVEPTYRHQLLVDAIKTLAWCIFWGLVLHGCIGNGIIIKMNGG
jgi:hypothetical protein